MHVTNWAQTCSITQLFHHFAARLRCHIIRKKRVSLRVSLTPLGLFTVRKYKLFMPSSSPQTCSPNRQNGGFHSIFPPALSLEERTAGIIIQNNPGTCMYGYRLLYKTFCVFQVPRAAFHHLYSNNCRWTAHNKVCPHRIHPTALCILLFLPRSKFCFDMSHR